MKKEKQHNCQQMAERLNYRCEDHSDIYDCPDNLVVYVSKFDEYGLIIHDGGKSYIGITYCPWCGEKLPPSRRDEWFETLSAMGYENPLTQKIPKKFLSDEWYRGPKRPVRKAKPKARGPGRQPR